MKTVDVIIPAYNAHKTINRALASVASQELRDYQKIRTVIVNDGGDDYHDIVEHWSKMLDICEIDRETNGGAGEARQTGIDATNSEFIMFLDADDMLMPYAVQLLLDNITTKDKEFDLAMGQMIEEKDRTLKGMNEVWMHGKMYRRSSIEKCGARFPSIRYSEDSAFNTVFFQLDNEFVFIQEPLYYWTENKESYTRKQANGWTYREARLDFFKGITWAFKELQRLGAEDEILDEIACGALAKTFYQFNESLTFARDYAGVLAEELKRMYQEGIKPLRSRGLCGADAVAIVFTRVSKKYNHITIPKITFIDYLRELGYYDA